jgi:cytochrome c nitrite reductase small subunit
MAPALLLTAAIGTVAGLGGYTFVYAKGTSYMGNDPATCGNCHVMQRHLEGWQNASHHAVATCNDCHTPANPVTKYIVKAANGFHHSYAFTSGDYPTNIRARESTRAVIEGQCRHCHADVVTAMGGPDVSCIRCHESVGHLK